MILSMWLVPPGDRRPSRRRALRAPAIACWALAALIAPARGAEHGKDLFGWVERVWVGESRLEMKAKLDTGADTSSLDATHIRRYRRGDERWVEFVVTNDETGRRVTFRKPLLRTATIKEHFGRTQRRPVVAVPVCLGDHAMEIEVSLVDRSGFLYPVLLGRSALQGIAVVDPEASLTRSPDCEAVP